MIREGRTGFALFAFAVGLLNVSLFGQAPYSGTGIQPFGSFDNSFGMVNLATLNMHFEIPLRSLPGRGIPLRTDLVWDTPQLGPPGYIQTTPPVLGYLGNGNPQYPPYTPVLGNFVAMGFTPGQVTYDIAWVAQCVVGSPPDQTNYGSYNVYSNFRYSDPHGGMHYFQPGPGGPTVASNASPSGIPCPNFHGNPGGPGTQGYFYPRDSSPYVLSLTGTATTPSTFVQDLTTGVVNDSIDLNGNTSTYANYGLLPASVTDSAGNLAITISSQTITSSQITTTFSYTGPAGSQQSIIVTEQKVNLDSSPIVCTNPTFTGGASNGVFMVSSIELPDTTSYQFTYEPILGRPLTITLPTGGTITYNYNGPNSGVLCEDGGTSGFTRTTADGTWTYSRTYSSSSKLFTTTVLDPQGNQTVYTFPASSGPYYYVPGYEIDRKIYQAVNSSQVLLREMITCYSGVFTNCPANATPIAYTNGGLGVVTQKDIFTYVPALGSSSLVETKYRFGDQITEVKTYDFGATSPPGTNFVSDRNISNYSYSCPSSDITTDRTTAVLAKTTYVCDAYAHPTSVSRWIQGTTYATTTNTYYGTGLLNTSQGPNGTVTTYTYGSCGSSFPSSVQTTTSTGSTRSTSTAWDCNGEVPTSQTDVDNNTTTNFSYLDASGVGDPFWRLRSTTYPDSGKVSTDFYDTASPPHVITSVLLDQSGDTVNTQIDVDGLNRPIHQITSGSGSGAPIPPSVEVDTTYDALGRVFTVSNPYTPPGSPSGVTTFYYDALGRKIEQVNPDLSGTKRWWCFDNVQTGGQPNCNTHKTSTVADWVDFADEDKNDWQDTVDGLGRITYVFEPSGGLSSGTYQAPTMETDYQYDGIGNLQSVAQKGKVGTDTARPTRSFIYDGLSRLTSSYNPENGTTTYGYDLNGNLQSKTAPAPNSPAGSNNTVTASYVIDGFNRIVSKSYNDSATTKTPTSCYLYGTPTNNTSGANQIGRLMYEWTQSASAGSCPGALPSNYLTMKYFAYDAMGRPKSTQQQQCNGSHCVASSPYALSLTYYASGNLNTLTNSVGNSGNSLTLTHLYDAGNHLMTLQSDWAAYPTILYSLNTSSSYGYNAYGPTNWCLGAGCTSSPPLNVTQGYDPYRLWVNNISVTGQVP